MTTIDYVVVADAATIRTVRAGTRGRKKDYVARFHRGQVVPLDPEVTDIERLIALKAIAPLPAEGETVTRTTAKVAVQAAGAEADPVAAKAAEEGVIEDEGQEPVVNEEPPAEDTKNKRGK